jgi:hypothetical protein
MKMTCFNIGGGGLWVLDQPGLWTSGKGFFCYKTVQKCLVFFQNPFMRNKTNGTIFSW